MSTNRLVAVSVRSVFVLRLVGVLAALLTATASMPSLFAVEPSETAPVAKWPGFLGAKASPLDASTLPLTWGPKQNIAWRCVVPGHGQSSPVIWGDQVFVTSTEGPKKELNHLICLSLTDGSVRWSREVASTHPVENSYYVSRAAPTPVVDEQGVFAFFESGDLLATSLAGDVLWQKSLAQEYAPPQNRFGLAASPVIYGDKLIVLVDDAGPSYLVAFSVKDGSVVWKSDRTSRESWTSPSLLTIAGQEQVVISSSGSVDGYDPQTGKQLWTFTSVGGNTSPTPLSAGENRLLVSASLGREGGNSEAAKNSNLILQINAKEGTFEPSVVWQTKEANPTFNSPIVYAGCAYWVNRAGVVYCYDAATGERHYMERLKEGGWATPLGVGDRVYIFGKDGVTTVLKSGPKYEVLAENSLWDEETAPVDNSLADAAAREQDPQRRRGAANFSGPIQYGVAAVNGSLLVRTGNTVFCLRNMPSGDAN